MVVVGVVVGVDQVASIVVGVDVIVVDVATYCGAAIAASRAAVGAQVNATVTLPGLLFLNMLKLLKCFC